MAGRLVHSGGCSRQQGEASHSLFSPAFSRYPVLHKDAKNIPPPRKLALGNRVPRVYTVACVSAIQPTFSHARPYPQQTARAAHC